MIDHGETFEAACEACTAPFLAYMGTGVQYQVNCPSCGAVTTVRPAFRCLYLDPPWYERGGGKYKRGADRHYQILKTPDIIRTIAASGVWNPHPDGAHVWCWSTNTYLPDALLLLEALGVRYVTNRVWVKPTIGLGQYLRGQHELCLFGVIGRPKKNDTPEARSQPSVLDHGTEAFDLDALDLAALDFNGETLYAPKREHSRKPPEAREAIEAISPGPRIELFAREAAPGWYVWGNETDRFARQVEA